MIFLSSTVQHRFEIVNFFFSGSLGAGEGHTFISGLLFSVRAWSFGVLPLLGSTISLPHLEQAPGFMSYSTTL